MILCTFCNSYPDNTEPFFFFACKYCSVFWDKEQLWLKKGNVVELNLSFIDIKYGNYEEGGKIVFFINTLLLLANNRFYL